MRKAQQLAEKEKNQEIENERESLIEMITQRRINLENEQKLALNALKAVKESGDLRDQIEEFNNSIEILRELKEDYDTKLYQTITLLENAIDDESYDSQSKISLEALKSLSIKIENHLKNVEKNGEIVEDFSGIGLVEETIQLAKQWIEFFLVKVTNAEKRETMKAQKEMLSENLDFIKENGEDDTGDLEEMIAQFQKQLDGLRISKWGQGDVDNLKAAINAVGREIDNIGFAGSHLSDAINQLVGSTMMSIE